jgi:hypothetical protein
VSGVLSAADLRQAATLLRTIASAEIARLELDEDRVRSLLDSVDPVEAMSLAAFLEVEASIRANVAGSTQQEEDHAFDFDIDGGSIRVRRPRSNRDATVDQAGSPRVAESENHGVPRSRIPRQLDAWREF